MIEPKHAETAKVMNEKRVGGGEGKPDEKKKCGTRLIKITRGRTGPEGKYNYTLNEAANLIQS